MALEPKTDYIDNLKYFNKSENNGSTHFGPLLIKLHT
jgi:hypothetical protein